jgi:uncharacterized protein (DUF488 family)
MYFKKNMQINELPKMMIFTIGHSNLSLDTFTNLLKQHNISTLVDVRSQPFSSYNPQFNQGNLANHLEFNHIKYRFLGDKLGGYPKHGSSSLSNGPKLKPDHLYQQGIAELIQIAEREQTVIMCSEGDFRECHRYYLISKTLVLQGIEVKHIQSDGSLCDNPGVQLSLQV